MCLLLGPREEPAGQCRRAAQLLDAPQLGLRCLDLLVRTGHARPLDGNGQGRRLLLQCCSGAPHLGLRHLDESGDDGAVAGPHGVDRRRLGELVAALAGLARGQVGGPGLRQTLVPLGPQRLLAAAQVVGGAAVEQRGELGSCTAPVRARVGRDEARPRPLGQRHGAACGPGRAPPVQCRHQRLRLARRVQSGRAGHRTEAGDRVPAGGDDVRRGLLRGDARRQRALQLRAARTGAARLLLVPCELLQRRALVEDPALAQRRPQLVAGAGDGRRQPRPLRVVPCRLLLRAVRQRPQRRRVRAQTVLARTSRVPAGAPGPAARPAARPSAARGTRRGAPRPHAPPRGPARPPPSSRAPSRWRRRGLRRAAVPASCRACAWRAPRRRRPRGATRRRAG